MVTGGDGAFWFIDEDEPLLITSTYYNAWYFINLENDDYSYENANSGIFINPSDYDSQNNTIYARNAENYKKEIIGTINPLRKKIMTKV